MGEAKRRKQMDSTWGKRLMPSNQQINDWLNSEAVQEWGTQHIGNIDLRWERLLSALIKQIMKDKNHDWRITIDGRPDICLGVNAEKWEIWTVAKKKRCNDIS